MSGYKYWIPYLGFETITESEFFSLAGYKKEAIEAEKYNTTRTWVTIGGIVAALAGSLLYSMSDSDAPGYTTGMVIMSIGAGLAVGGSYMFLSNKYPLNIATNVADEFNSQLKLKILDNY